MSPGSVVIFFPSDLKFMVMLLDKAKCVNAATASVNSWMLVEDKPLGVRAGETALDPPSNRGVGRPRTKRLAKVAGPMSIKKKKGNKKGKRKPPTHPLKSKPRR